LIDRLCAAKLLGALKLTPSSKKVPSQADYAGEEQRARIEDDFNRMQRCLIRHDGTFARLQDRLVDAIQAVKTPTSSAGLETNTYLAHIKCAAVSSEPRVRNSVNRPSPDRPLTRNGFWLAIFHPLTTQNARGVSFHPQSQAARKAQRPRWRTPKESILFDLL
jgi:hypothetical protein